MKGKVQTADSSVVNYMAHEVQKVIGAHGTIKKLEEILAPFGSFIENGHNIPDDIIQIKLDEMYGIFKKNGISLSNDLRPQISKIIADIAKKNTILEEGHYNDSGHFNSKISLGAKALVPLYLASLMPAANSYILKNTNEKDAANINKNLEILKNKYPASKKHIENVEKNIGFTAVKNNNKNTDKEFEGRCVTYTKKCNPIGNNGYPPFQADEYNKEHNVIELKAPYKSDTYTQQVMMHEINHLRPEQKTIRTMQNLLVSKIDKMQTDKTSARDVARIVQTLTTIYNDNYYNKLEDFISRAFTEDAGMYAMYNAMNTEQGLSLIAKNPSNAAYQVWDLFFRITAVVYGEEAHNKVMQIHEVDNYMKDINRILNGNTSLMSDTPKFRKFLLNLSSYAEKIIVPVAKAVDEIGKKYNFSLQETNIKENCGMSLESNNAHNTKLDL